LDTIFNQFQEYRILKKLLTVAALTILLATTTETAMASTGQWSDWPNEPEQVRQFISNNGLMLGYPDGTFRPWDSVTEKQVIRVCKRAGIRTDLDESQYSDQPAKMGWVQQYFLPGTVYSAGMDEECTRYRFAIMLYRYGLNPGPSEIPPTTSEEDLIAQALDQWFDETYVNGFQSRLVGTGRTFVEESIEHNIPIWFALGQCWAESQFFTTGLSKTYNMGWGIKASPSNWGELGVPPTINGFGNYVTVEEAVRAYFSYLDLQTTGSGNRLYRDKIDNGDWQGIINIYAPSSDGNDTSEYMRIVYKVKNWAEDRGINR
jgi:hypothetical protein